MRAVTGGLIGGAVGALLWAAIVYFTGYEVGWIAWIVGGLVGFGVAWGNADGSRTPTAAGTLAVVVAALSIVAGRYVSIRAMMPSDDEIVEMALGGFEEEEYVISYIADDVAAEFATQGRELAWPGGVEPVTASMEEEYPADVWAEAEARWSGLTEAQRTEFRESREAAARENVLASLPEIRAAMAGDGFMGSFTPIDIIFFGLAVVTAWGVGSGGKKTAEEIAEEYGEAVQLAMIKVMTADGTVDDEEVRAVSEVYQQLTGSNVSVEVIRAKATLAVSEGKDLQASLVELEPHLSGEGKRMVLRAAVVIAVADGEFGERERGLIEEIAHALAVSEEQLREVVAELTRAPA